MVYLIPLDLDLSKAPRGATVIGATARRVTVREHREDVCKLACHLKAPVHGVHGKPNDDFPRAEQHSPYDGVFEAIVPHAFACPVRPTVDRNEHAILFLEELFRFNVQLVVDLKECCRVMVGRYRVIECPDGNLSFLVTVHVTEITIDDETDFEGKVKQANPLPALVFLFQGEFLKKLLATL